MENALKLPTRISTPPLVPSPLNLPHFETPGFATAYVSQLNQYISEVQSNSFWQPSSNCASALIYWQNRLSSLDKLAPVALDILAAPASQAYVERIFSISGLFIGVNSHPVQGSGPHHFWGKVGS
jgi:hypothetical protein